MSVRSFIPHSRTAAVKALAVASLLGVAPVLSGCGDDSEASGKGTENQVVRYQTGAGSLSLIELADNLGYLKPLTIKSVGATISGPQDIQSTATDQTDIGNAFYGAIIKLVQAGAPIKSVVAGYGSDKHTFAGFYVLENSPIKTARDLIGKKVGVNTLGAHSDAILQTWLKKNGLTPQEAKQVEQVVIPPVNTEQALRAKQIDVGVLNGPLQDKATSRGGVRLLFSDYEFLGTFTAGAYVLREKYIKENPEAAKTIATGIGKAITWQQTHSKEEVIAKATEIAEAHGRPEDVPILKFWKSPGIGETGGVLQEKDIQRWVTWLETASIIPKDSVKASDVYTNDLNEAAAGATAAGTTPGTTP